MGFLCKRADSFSTATAVVCSRHFSDADYERDLKSELLNMPEKKRLKIGAVPHLFLPTGSGTINVQNSATCTSDRKIRVEKRGYRQEADYLLRTSKFSRTITESNDADVPASDPEPASIDSPVENQSTSFSDEQPQEVMFLYAENEKLKKENEALREKLSEANYEISQLKHLSQVIGNKFSASQQQMLVNGRCTLWPSEEIAKAVTLRCLSFKALTFVRQSAILWNFLLTIFFGYGIIGVESWFKVVLTAPHYVGVGTSAKLICDHSVNKDVLYKIEWLKTGKKFFQYVRDRKPPFKNFTLKGATISWSENSESQITLKDITTNASGYYSCEVSTDSPIYTKSSEFHEIIAIELQKEAPKIYFGKQNYRVGDWLLVNCTSKIQSHISWLLNGTRVDSEYIKYYKGKTAELKVRITEDHAPKIKLTCLTGKGDSPRASNTIFVDVIERKTESEFKITSSDLRVSCSTGFQNKISFLLLILSLLQSGWWEKL